MTRLDTETEIARVAGWLGEGYATWGAPIGGVWAEFQILPPGAHGLAEVLERHLPVGGAR